MTKMLDQLMGQNRDGESGNKVVFFASCEFRGWSWYAVRFV